MIARSIGSGWQTILADLSLILFMVTAAALANAPDAPLGPDVPVRRAPPPPPPPPVAPSAQAEAVGVWRAGPDAPPLAGWLADVARDPRLRVTIAVHYAAGDRAGALYRARLLSEAAGPRAGDARIVVEPGEPVGASATVGYDAGT